MTDGAKTESATRHRWRSVCPRFSTDKYVRPPIDFTSSGPRTPVAVIGIIKHHAAISWSEYHLGKASEFPPTRYLIGCWSQSIPTSVSTALLRPKNRSNYPLENGPPHLNGYLDSMPVLSLVCPAHHCQESTRMPQLYVLEPDAYSINITLMTTFLFRLRKSRHLKTGRHSFAIEWTNCISEASQRSTVINGKYTQTTDGLPVQLKCPSSLPYHLQYKRLNLRK